MKNNFDTETFDSKDDRDRRFAEMKKRNSGTVKFSGCRDRGVKDRQGRMIYTSTWSVAWPRD